MVRVPGSSGDSQGFHRESDEDATQIKLEPGIEVSGGASRKNFIHKHPVGLARYRKEEEAEVSSKQLKAPDSDTEDRGDQQWTNEELAQAFCKKDLFSFLLDDPVMKILNPTLIGELQGPTMEPAETPRQLEAATQLLRILKDAGITPGAFNASEIFDLETSVIQHSARVLYEKLEPLVGSITQPETVRLTPTRSPVYQTGSSQYASATSEAESDSSADLQRMTLGPNPEQMQTFFNAAMSRYLKETQTEGLTPTAGRHTTTNQDVEMESVESHHGSHGEYDPDNLNIDTPRQAVIASAGAASAPSTTTPRIRVSAISELKEYSGKDHDGDRARGWLGEVQSAFVRDQAPDSEKWIRVAEDSSESESDVNTSDQEDYLAEAKDRENHSITPTHRDAADHPTMSQKNSKSTGKINNEKATLLFDSGAEVSIVDSTFAQGRARIKITLAGAYVYYFDVWVGDLSRQEAILGMDFVLFSGNSRLITFDQLHKIPVAESVEIAIRRSASDGQKLCVTREEQWIPTAVKGLGSTQYLRITNVSERPVTLQRDTRVGIWKETTYRGYQGSSRSGPRDTLMLQYEPPTKILAGRRERPKAMIVMSALARESTTAPDIAGEKPAGFQPKEKGRSDTTEPTGEIRGDREQPRSTELGGTQLEPKEEADDGMDDAVCYHEGGDIFPEDIENNMAVLLEERERLRRIIWKRRHLLIGPGNALPPAPFGAICDIEVGTAKPVAQRCRRVALQFRDKLSMLIKGLLSAKIISTPTSPWASPIVVIIKANGVDIRLCIDYQVMNSLTRLMVYPMPLINDLLEGLDKALWYGSLDMASGLWVVSMTPRAKLVSAFITPFGLFEGTRMPFGLKNAHPIYQRIVDNALYGHMRIKPDQDRSSPVDVFEEGDPEPKPMCNRVDKLLDVCDRWNLSISVAKSYWGRRKVAYLGHEVSSAGLESKPKELDAIANLPFPIKLKAMQSFLGSLNYYSRFIEDFAVYAAILYELREADFHEIAKMDTEETQAEDGQLTGGERDMWVRGKNAFTMPKAKIIATPVLKHFDPERTPIIVLYANKWAISAALMREHEDVYHPVTFSSRTLKANELNYGEGIGASANLGRLLLTAGYQIDQGLVTILDIGLVAQVEWVRRSTG
ncbi:reverse transcriptase [Phytophthora megakarya]|uniref:Reverse transcriptase n=1 Tax=Phytophthora megakarya TaxID=4795 RepID=A0A225VU80_9STRA|nr:reverse transcriptase [Phytophthora megakarya]